MQQEMPGGFASFFSDGSEYGGQQGGQVRERDLAPDALHSGNKLTKTVCPKQTCLLEFHYFNMNNFQDMHAHYEFDAPDAPDASQFNTFSQSSHQESARSCRTTTERVGNMVRTSTVCT